MIRIPMRQPRVPLALLFAAGLLCASTGCIDQSLTVAEADISVTWPGDHGYPDAIAFGTVSVGTYDEVPVTITNSGQGVLTVSDVSLTDASDNLTLEAEATELSADEVTVARVRFAPMDNGEWGNALVVTNSVTESPIEIPITMNADGDPVPDIYADPDQHDYGDVQIYSGSIQEFHVGNAGLMPLEVGQVAITGWDPDVFAITYDEVSERTFDVGSLPGILTVEFSPGAVEPYEADLEIYSNDPDEDPLVVPLSGDGWTPGGDGPVAVCDVIPNPVHPIVDVATWIGHNSYDTSGYMLTSYKWELVSVPAGSSAWLPLSCYTGNGSTDCTFTADSVGTYTAQLTVENLIGQTGTCQVNLEAIPPAGLWVEMYWTLPYDDMDLHMLAPGGTLWSDSDCHFGNCISGGIFGGNLDWGQQGYDGDDPSLDLDDIPGTGPENINMEDPEPNGMYKVYVHDYSGSNSGEWDADPSQGNHTTVNIYLDAILVWTDTRAISGDGNEVPFCEIDWASQTVTDL